MVIEFHIILLSFDTSSMTIKILYNLQWFQFKVVCIVVHVGQNNINLAVTLLELLLIDINY
jgi:hypothetical protein